jgi:enoyl-CoA hydratase/carnithine racemase
VYETILFEADAGIATVTLHRPEKRNAYTPKMGVEIVDAFARIRDDDAVHVAILAGAGRGFCAGVDLDELAKSRAGGETRLGQEPFLRSFPLELAEFPKPTIAALHGAAVGVGVTMVLPCDLRVAAADAKLSLPFVELGILPGLGSTHLLPRLVGLARAQELVLTGRSVGAEEAAAMGLVNLVVPAEQLLPRARELATAIAACAPEVVAAARRALRHGAAASLEEALRFERAESAALRGPRKR